MRTRGFGEGRKAEQAMPQASGRRPEAQRINPFLSWIYLSHGLANLLLGEVI